MALSSALRNGSVMIPLTAGLCLILLTVILKNVPLFPAEELSTHIILFILIYIGFIISYPLQKDTEPGSSTRMMLWLGLMLLTTFGIIVVIIVGYVIKP